MHSLTLLIYLAGTASLVSASDSLSFLKSGLIAEADVKETLSSELHMDLSHSRMRRIFYSFDTMYKALPKNARGKLDHQAVRYALHRFFVHSHGWFIRGLEPSNDTWHGAPNPDAHNSSAMKEWVPSYLQDILEQKLGVGGSDQQQLAALAAALADLVEREVLGRLASTYSMHGFSKDTLLTAGQAGDVINTFFTGFLIAGEFTVKSLHDLEYQKERFTHEYVGWPQAEQWLLDLSKVHLKSHQNFPGEGGRPAYAYQDIEYLVSMIGQEFYKLNDKECSDLKQTMKGMQGKKPGRVRLSTFYHYGMYTHWHFTEKVDYLRALGALDDSDPQQPYVIISNYAMARPNCLDSSTLYTICCRNECEDLMDHLESEIAGATATPSRLVDVVSKLPSPTVAAPRNLPKELVSRLTEVAKQHGGEVPMHGRLFAQWMHHAYPLECPYPHELGVANPQTPDEWMKETGHKSEVASTEEMAELVALDTCAVDSSGKPDCADETPDLPWTDSEELLTWHPRDKASVVSQPGLAGVLLEGVLAVAGITIAFVVVRQHTNRALQEDDNAKAKRGFKGVVAPLAIVILVSLVLYFTSLLDWHLFACILVCSVVVVGATRGFQHKGCLDTLENKCVV